jgi:putative phosphoribosyl transferase
MTAITPETARPIPGLHAVIALDYLGMPVPGLLDLPERPCGMVVFAQGFGGVRTDRHTALLAERLGAAGIGTLRIELIDEANAIDPCHVQDVEALTGRLDRAVHWLRHRPDTAVLPCALFGTGTGAAAVLLLAARPGSRIDAVVCHGGRPELAGPHLADVHAPTLLLAGSRNRGVIPQLREIRERLAGPSDLILVPSGPRDAATHQELVLTADVLAGWLLPRLGAAAAPEAPGPTPPAGATAR